MGRGPIGYIGQSNCCKLTVGQRTATVACSVLTRRQVAKDGRSSAAAMAAKRSAPNTASRYACTPSSQSCTGSYPDIAVGGWYAVHQCYQRRAAVL